MAATADFRQPDWNSPVDTDIDQIRDNLNYLLTVAVAGSHVAPGWVTEIDVSENNNFAQPDAVSLTSGTRQIKVNIEWE